MINTKTMNTQQHAASRTLMATPAEKLILIVDDEKDICDLIAANAAKEGFRTATANSADEALAKIEAAAPDLIVLDLAMPGQSGYELMRSLQAGGSGSIPVVIVTAR